MRNKALFMLLGLLIWGPSSFGQIANKTKLGNVRTTDSLNETRPGYVLIPAAGKALKALIEANTLALAGKQAALVPGVTIRTINGQNPLGSGDISFPTSATGGSIGGKLNYNGTLVKSTSGDSLGVNLYTEQQRFKAYYEATLKSYDGYDPTITKVLSTTGSTFRWILPASGSPTSGTSVGSTTMSMRDSVLFWADSTKSRFVANASTATVTLSTIAQIRNFLTTTQSNVDAVIANGNYNDGNPFEQNSTWTNVRLRAQTKGQVTLQNDAYSMAWIFQGGAQRTAVCLKDFNLVTNHTGTGTLAIFTSNELVKGDGVELDGLDITSNGKGSYNGIGVQQYSRGSNSGETTRNWYIHNCNIHDIGRGNEILSQGYDKIRMYGIVMTNNRFVRTGLADKTAGFGMSISGFIQGVYEAFNYSEQNEYASLELVNLRLAILRRNTVNTLTSGSPCVGIGVSDDDGNKSTKYIWVEDNTTNTSARPFYNYGTQYTYWTGGNYTGRQGIDTKANNATYSNMTATIWPAAGTPYTYCWQADVQTGYGTNNSFSNLTITSAGTQANSTGGVPKETMLVQAGANNNTFTNLTTIIGKKSDGSYDNSGAIVNRGTGNTITNNLFSQGN